MRGGVSSLEMGCGRACLIKCNEGERVSDGRESVVFLFVREVLWELRSEMKTSAQYIYANTQIR